VRHAYLIWLLASTLCFAVGEYLSKRFAVEPRLATCLELLACYNVGVLLWLPAVLGGGEPGKAEGRVL
jgi:hypothetical protein